MTENRQKIHVEIMPDATPPGGALGKLDPGAGYVSGGAGGWLRPVSAIDTDELKRGIEQICAALTQAMRAAAPEAWTVEFGLGFKASGGVPILLSGESNVALKITLSWKKPSANGKEKQ
jgi:hypothetical protein